VFAVYGLALGAILAGRGLDAGPSPRAARPPEDEGPSDGAAEAQTASWQEHMRRIYRAGASKRVGRS
jgi:hypothetical protein